MRATLTKSSSSATGSATGATGGNVFNAWISDLAGNQSFDSALLLIEDGAPPIITIISPLDGGSYETNTPYFEIEFYDVGTYIALSSFEVILDGVDISSQFTVYSDRAVWWPSPGEILSGEHDLSAAIQDIYLHLASVLIHFRTSQSAPSVPITKIEPDFTIGGDTVTIVGSNFGSTVDVYFTGTQDYVMVQAAGILPGATHFDVKVPGSAVTGPVFVESLAGSFNRSNNLDFTMGLPYAYITNRGSHAVTVFDYRDNSVLTSILQGGTPTAYAADIIPDGRYAFVANYARKNVIVIDTLSNTISKQVDLSCITGLLSPRSIAITPDGARAFVATENKYLAVINVRGVLGGDTSCSSVQPWVFTDGYNFYDIALTPDGKHAMIPANGSPGVLVAPNIERYYLGDGATNSNNNYLAYVPETLQGDTWSRIYPQGACILPQRTSTAPNAPWWAIIANKGLTGSLDQNALIYRFEQDGIYYQHIIFNHGMTGFPIRQGGVDCTTSHLGEKAFIAFTNTNNIGVTGVLESNTNDVIEANTINYWPGNMREVAYAPYREKVLATVYAMTQADSRVLVLDATLVPNCYKCRIPASAFTSRQNTYINGPEGIGMQPLFDRDRDGISDLVEAVNQGTGTLNLHPTIAENPVSVSNGNDANGSITGSVRLPEEGIGYRHFYGTDHLSEDNWAILRTVQVIEKIGREWNQIHPDGPRISIGDLSIHNGGPRPGVGGHANGKEMEVRYVLTQRSEAPTDFCNPPVCWPQVPGNYDRTETQKLVDLFIKSGATLIIVDPLANITGNGVTAPTGTCGVWDPQSQICAGKTLAHSNHIHVQLR